VLGWSERKKEKEKKGGGGESCTFKRPLSNLKPLQNSRAFELVRFRLGALSGTLGNLVDQLQFVSNVDRENSPVAFPAPHLAHPIPMTLTSDRVLTLFENRVVSHNPV